MRCSRAVQILKHQSALTIIEAGITCTRFVRRCMLQGLEAMAGRFIWFMSARLYSISMSESPRGPHSRRRRECCRDGASVPFQVSPKGNRLLGRRQDVLGGPGSYRTASAATALWRAFEKVGAGAATWESSIPGRPSTPVRDVATVVMISSTRRPVLGPSFLRPTNQPRRCPFRMGPMGTGPYVRTESTACDRRDRGIALSRAGLCTRARKVGEGVSTALFTTDYMDQLAGH